MATGTVTLLFTDLVNSTRLLESLGDEDFETLRRRHFRILRDVVADGGGEEVKNLGDGLMVAFSSAVDAVATAVSMQRAVARDGDTTRLDVRVGLHVGEPLRDEGDYFGTSVVVAKRLCDSARGGQIIVSDLVRGLVGSRGGHSFLDLPPLVIKGIREPFRACEVMWEAGEEDPLPLPAQLSIFEMTTLVGRDKEMETLVGHWDRPRDGSRRIALISGAPGVGKTRLAAEMALSARESGGVVLYGRCDEGNLVPYQPFVEGLTPVIAALAREDLRALLRRGGRELARIVPALGEKVPDLEDGPPADAETRRFALFEAVSLLLQAAAERGPVLFVLDDLHWADRPTLLMLRHLLRASGTGAVLMLGTCREHEQGPALTDLLVDLQRERLLDKVSLSGLDTRDISELLEAWAERACPQRVAEAIRARTEGNPLFIAELLRDLFETGVLRHGEQLWPPGPAIDAIATPSAVKLLIKRRVLHLSGDCRALLGAASAIGREWSADLLARVSTLGGEAFLAALDEAAAAGIVSETAGDDYAFTHALIRHALYEDLTAARRVRMHKSIALALEGVPGSSAREIAHHHLQGVIGGDADKALAWASRAAEEAARATAHEEAALLYSRALLVLGGKDPRRRCELLLALADAQTDAGDIANAKRSFLAALEVARVLDDPELRARAAVGRGGPGFGSWLEWLAVDEELVRELDGALSQLSPQDSALRVKLLLRLASELYFSAERDRSAGLSREALEMAERLGDTEALGQALSARRFIQWGPGALQDRIEIGTRIVALSEEAGGVLALAGRAWRAFDMLELGDLTAADAEMAAYESKAGEAPPHYRVMVPRYRAMRATVDGRFADAEGLAMEALTLGLSAEPQNAPMAYGAQMFAIEWHRGRLHTLGRTVAAIVEEAPFVPVYRCALAVIYTETDRAARAKPHVDALVEGGLDLIPHDANWFATMALLSQASAALGDKERCVSLYDMLVPFGSINVTMGGPVACLGPSARYLGLLAAGLERRPEARGHFEDALAMAERMGSLPWTAHTQADYARMLLESGRDRTRSDELFARAGNIAVEIGMDWLMKRGS